MREKECQAPIHSPDCSCQRCTKTSCGNCHCTNIDHFTPRCIADIWGWSRKQTDAPENLQYLSRECHREKDATTPDRKMLLLRQRKGDFISLDEYRKIL